MDTRPIGVFDSGIGGLTVLKKIIEVLPNEEYIYYADKVNAPIACNTATSIAINDLRNKYSIPIIGIEPAAKPAVENKGAKRVLIMATPTTIKEEKLKNLLEKLNAKEYVDLIDMPKLVEFAEKGDFESNQVKKYIEEKLKQYNLNEYSELVLGCTHFPFFKKALSNIFPKDTQIIDGSLGVANRLKNILEEQKLLGNNKLKIKYYNSGKLDNQEKMNKLLC